jgi:hypothetical protein
MNEVNNTPEQQTGGWQQSGLHCLHGQRPRPLQHWHWQQLPWWWRPWHPLMVRQAGHLVLLLHPCQLVAVSAPMVQEMVVPGAAKQGMVMLQGKATARGLQQWLPVFPLQEVEMGMVKGQQQQG